MRAHSATSAGGGSLLRPDSAQRGSVRQELRWLGLEVLTLFAIFIVGFTGRDSYAEGIRSLLYVLSVIAGLAGIAGGLLVAARGFSVPSARVARLGIAAAMIFFGAYTVVHVLS